jgi:hypothetical protein
MSITILQQPLGFTPSNAQHIYNASSTYSGQTSMRYIFDIWINPLLSTQERIGRLKVAPNSFGVGMVDVGDIIKNYLKPNPRSESPQQYVFNGTNGTGTTTPNGVIINNSLSASSSNSISFVPSNAFNSNVNYELLRHCSQYKVLIGEEFVVGSTTVSYICDNPSYLTPSTLTYEFSTSFVPYPGSPTTINWNNINENVQDWMTGVELGYSYLHTSSTGVFVDSGSSVNTSGSYTSSGEPGRNDLVYLTDRVSGCIYVFQWSDETSPSGWVYLSTSCPDCSNQPNSIIIWPGVQENKTNFSYNNNYWTNNTNGVENWKYWELYKYQLTGSTFITETSPAQFLTTFGDDLFTDTITVKNSGGTVLSSLTNDRIRRRQHHPECPIILSNYFAGFNDTIFTQTITQPVCWVKSETQDNFTLTGSQNYGYLQTNLLNISAYTNNPDNWIVYHQPRTNTIGGGKMALFVQSNTASTANFFSNRISEIVEYYFTDDSCMSDPQHFLFLNQRGSWDTWTFDRKNIKRYQKEFSTYGQDLIRNSPNYNPFFYDNRAVIYDQNVNEVVEAQSDYMVENDRKIVEELFLSTSVYLIQDYPSQTIPSSAYSHNPYLIPVIITSNSLEQFKNRYNKLYQYTLTYEYNPRQLFRSNL